MEENLKQQQSSILKFAMFGPDSSGKITLAKQLATHFETVWATEFRENYLLKKFNETGQNCEPEDLLPIAIGQSKLENDALLTANNFIFCSNNVLSIKVFSEQHYNFCDPVLEKAARKHKYDLFFLINCDDAKPNESRTKFVVFKNTLIENGKPFITLSGDVNSRFEEAKKAIEDLVKAKEMGFSSYDFVQIYEKKIPLETISSHFKIFKEGIQKAVLIKPALKDDGILKKTDSEFQELASYFESKKDTIKIKKFVPASGAASRMFKFLNEFLNEYDIENETINGYINRKNATNLTVFLTGLEKFPFFNAIDSKLKELHSDFNTWEKDKKNYHFIKLLLDSDNFDFSNKPKGILPFHKYATTIATPIEEHLNESAFYGSANGFSYIHFTISKNHQVHFENIIKSVKNKIENTSGSKININFSFQNTVTDTIAVDLNNNPFRNENGELVFRPAGHGALIENLNNLDADIVFIKNIDNVIQNHIESISLYKKALAGILLKLQDEIFQFLKQIEINLVPETYIETIIVFIQEKLNVSIIDDFSKYTLENKISYIQQILHRPIRVCGMVKNEGEPGGGPFWVRDIKGTVSLQIVESSQIDLQNPNQANILASATHFNPVDLVCAIKDYQGNKFNLNKFIDPTSGFIVQKNKNGKDLKAYELPGLWNGAMAKWITVFVEVPLSTFNPVKTVNDLLKAAHQPQ